MYPRGRGDQESTNQDKPKKVVYHPEAFEEFIEAAEYYEVCSPGLGNRFIDSIEKGVSHLLQNAFLYKPDKLGRRKYIIKKFPYLLIYKIKDNCIFILAAAHAARKPGYWKYREVQESF